MANFEFNQKLLFAKAKRVLANLGDVAVDDFLKRDLAQYTKTMIYRRVKAGKGVTSTRTRFEITNHQRFKPLSNNYKSFRRTGIVTFQAKQYTGRFYEVVTAKINVGKPTLGEFASPNKSNLTMTGQMLKSMTFKISKIGFTILIPETVRRGSKVTNAQIARWVQKDRPFMNLTAGEVRIVKSRMKNQIMKRLRKLLK